MNLMVRVSFAVALSLLAVGSVAQAGRRPFLYAYDTTAVPDGDVEIESWLDYIDARAAQVPDAWRWWIGPRWAPTDGVEVMALTALQQSATASASAQLWGELLEARWRVLASPAAGNLTLQLDLRIALSADIPHQLQPQVGWAKRAGRFLASAQAGYARGFEGPPGKATYDWITWRAGVAVDAVRGEISAPLELGVESFGEATVQGRSDQQTGGGSVTTLGPTVSVAHGRLWLTAGVLLGLTDESPRALVRGIIGLAL
jgi:hypothetical protein